jgi:hypothetical protein
MDHFILEYNENQGSFHHNYGNSELETHGWVTISKTNDKEELLFGKWLEIEIYYQRGAKIRTEKIKELWNRFKKVNELFNK